MIGSLDSSISEKYAPGQHSPLELSVVMETVYSLYLMSSMVAAGYVWLLSSEM